MAKDESIKRWHERRWGKTGDTVYALGIIGALFYYIQNAVSFGDGVIGVLKALIWPAFLVYNLLEFLGM